MSDSETLEMGGDSSDSGDSCDSGMSTQSEDHVESAKENTNVKDSWGETTPPEARRPITHKNTASLSA